ncbi:MAG: PD40 domain-containing protein [Armatimonadetes bacterium]|nr:PD40 domain-containing protein [Armatimonadota bacterium]
MSVAVIALALLQGGCGGGGGGGAGSGGMTGGGAAGRLLVLADFEDPTRVVPGYADSLRVTVTSPPGVELPGNIPNPFVLDRLNRLRGLDGLEPSAQPYVLDMEALTDGTVVGTARRSIIMSAGEIREVEVSANLLSAIAEIVVEGASSLIWNDGQYTAFAKDDQGATLFSGAGFSFTSSNPPVLSIDQETGFATANTFGTATLTAVLLGTAQSGQLAVTVEKGTKIVFMSQRDDSFGEIYVMNTDGSRQTRLTDSYGYDYDPAFSPDGSKIAFTSSRHWENDVFTMNADGTGLTRLTDSYHQLSSGSAAFSLDGSQIVFEALRDGNSEIYVMNADGSGQARLTNHPFTDSDPAFSPDGSKIAFMSRRNLNWDIYIMNADGSEVTQLTTDAADDKHPWFSADGSKIVFDSKREGNSQIYFMNADGSGQTRLTTSAEPELAPAFSLDGSKITFSCFHDGNWEVCVMNADGSGIARLTNNSSMDGLSSFGG